MLLTLPTSIAGKQIKNYSSSDIYNTDGLRLFYKLASNKKSIGKDRPQTFQEDKLNKDCLTFLLSVNSDTPNELQLLVTGKLCNPRYFKNVKNLPCTKATAERGWPTIFFLIWSHNFDQRMQKDSHHYSVLLLVDNCPMYLSDNKGLKRIPVEFLDPNQTTISQPMDKEITDNTILIYKPGVVRLCLYHLEHDSNSSYNEVSN